MSRDQHRRPAPSRPARLALQLPDAGSSGVIDLNDLRAEPLPLSLRSTLALARPGPAPSPPPRPWWPRVVLGSSLALCLGMLGLATTLSATSTVMTERSGAVDGQLLMHEASVSPGALATAAPPSHASEDDRTRALSGAHEPDAAPDETTSDAAEATSATPPEPEPEPEAKLTPKTKTPASQSRTRTRVAKSSPAPSPVTKPASKGDGSISVECVLDPARCSSSGAATKAPSTTATARPAPLPAKLTATALKQALATTKADARRCGPEHGMNPGTTVRVKLSIEGTTGAVLSATPMDEHAQGSLGRCVAGALGQTKFPRFTAKQMGTIYSVRL